MNWGYDDALITADRHAFFKARAPRAACVACRQHARRLADALAAAAATRQFMLRSCAEARGLRVTFMPKPFTTRTGSGAHCHVSAWGLKGSAQEHTNLFADDAGELGLSPLAYSFMAGVLASAQGLCALTNPTVNSYKRLNAAVTRSGATWSPNTVTYTGNNRTHMLRIPDGGRFEFRLPDGAVNPYLLQAGLLAAGLSGVAAGAHPGTRYDDDFREVPPPPGVRTLPGNLLDALRALEADAPLRAALGDSFIASYVKLKMASWREYAAHLSQWEVNNTLDV
jgi:glutamine synthetase